MTSTLLTIAVAASIAFGSTTTIAEPGDAEPCAMPSHVWFLGAVYDSAQRNDFKIDVTLFELFLSTLRATYCIPDTQAEILAFDRSYTVNGKTYAAASEANVRDRLSRYGSAAAAHADSIVFYFHSSHGIMYARGQCSTGERALGSLAALGRGNGHDGTFTDCDLGDLLAGFAPTTRAVVVVDCSFCGGFSDSITAIDGTIPPASPNRSSRVPGPNRIVITGCAITTECFGSAGGGVLFKHMAGALDPASCDGFTAPGFPAVQGVDAPVRMLEPDGRCGTSELFFAAVDQGYRKRDAIAIQQQFRIRYGFASLAEDITFV